MPTETTDFEPEPPRIEGDDMGGVYDQALLTASYDARRLHMFRYRWLKHALSEAEYRQVRPLPGNLLKSLYPYVYAGGPEGGRLYRQAKNILAILDNKITDVNADEFLADFIACYKEKIGQLQHANSRDVFKNIWNLAAVDDIPIDTDQLLSPFKELYTALNDSETVTGVFVNDSGEWLSISMTLDDHLAMVETSFIMASIPEAAEVLALHTTFVEKYGLDAG